jgi:hypothetical protein
MRDAVEAAAVLVPEARTPRAHKPTDLHFKVRFSKVPDEEALERLGGLDQAAPPDPETGACYRAHLSPSGFDLYGESGKLRGRHLRRGDLLKMEIHAGGTRARVRCLGLIAWLRVDHDAGLFGMGVGFVGVDPRDLN